MKNSYENRGNDKPEGYTVLSPDQAVVGRETIADYRVVIDPKAGLIVKAGEPGDVDAWLKAEKGEKGKRVVSERLGGALFAGLTDAHEHPIFFSTLDLFGTVYLHGVGDKAEVLRRLRTAARTTEPTNPVMAVGLDTSKVQNLTMGDLRLAVGERDAAVFDASFHGAVVSRGMAAKIAAVTKDQPELAGYLKADGTVTEEHAMVAFQVAESAYSIEQIEKVTTRKLDKYLRQGITSVHDLFVQTTDEFIAGLLARKHWKEERGIEFPITRFHLRKEQIEKIGRRLPELERMGLLSPEEFPTLVNLKLFADGSFGSHTALMSEDYQGGKGRGIEFDRAEYLNQAMRVAAEHGINSVAMHAIGDAGIQRAIGTARQWIRLAEERRFDPKFRIEHFELPLPVQSTLAEVKSLGVWVTPQPNFLLDYVYEDRLGERVRWICPHQKILDEKIPMMFGTDGMPDSMLYAIYLATHAAEPHQRLSMADAILASNLAVAHFEGDNRGAIAEGQKADIVMADPALLRKLAAGESDVHDNAETIAELEGAIRSVYKSGVEVFNKYANAAKP
jgi:predicted amidohydrolase YtcJ